MTQASGTPFILQAGSQSLGRQRDLLAATGEVVTKAETGSCPLDPGEPLSPGSTLGPRFLCQMRAGKGQGVKMVSSAGQELGKDR